MAGYSLGAPLYLAAGWTRFVPLDSGKGVVPKGVSGHQGADPTPEQRAYWLRTKGDANGCLILAEGVIGLDVDHYDGENGVKRGGDTLAHADTLWGPRPPTVRSTSRTDGVSGISLYRVPDGTPLLAGQIKFVLDDGTVLSDIEIVQHHHRNVNCWPSWHAKTGRQYQWLDEDDTVVGIPTPESLPLLSPRWVAWLVAMRGGGHRSAQRARSPREAKAYSAAEAAAVARAMTLGGMSATVTSRLEQALAELSGPGCRYDGMVGHTLALLRYGYNGAPGVEHALDVYQEAYRDAVCADRDGGDSAADNEFERAVRGTGWLLLHDLSFDPLGTDFPLDPEIAARFEEIETAMTNCCNEFDDFDETAATTYCGNEFDDFDETPATTHCGNEFDGFDETDHDTTEVGHDRA
jgi:hypothetical protein